jgi:hypothetical protein
MPVPGRLTFALLALHALPKLAHGLAPGHAAAAPARAEKSGVLSSVLDLGQAKLERRREERRERVGLRVVEPARPDVGAVSTSSSTPGRP